MLIITKKVGQEIKLGSEQASLTLLGIDNHAVEFNIVNANSMFKKEDSFRVSEGNHIIVFDKKIRLTVLTIRDEKIFIGIDGCYVNNKKYRVTVIK